MKKEKIINIFKGKNSKENNLIVKVSLGVSILFFLVIVIYFMVCNSGRSVEDVIKRPTEDIVKKPTKDVIQRSTEDIM
ncbi:MAG: hypothetical protein KAH22_07390, partial [Thiotrichaceae bacterium]|nr:hypothetical protein [Thiotrichaceae bacterium]